jgi:hypothetical protein
MNPLKHRSGSFAVLALTGLLTFASCGPNADNVTIDRATVDRVIRTLAADDMQGRATFSPGIEKAATFLEGEFARIGLEKFDGLDSYRQSFTMYSLAPAGSHVELNGSAVAPENVFFLAGAASVAWTEADAIPVTLIGPDDDFAAFFAQARQNTTSSIVLVDPSHRDLFTRYRGFFSRPRNVLGMDDSGTLVFIITPAASANSYRVDIQTDVSERPLANIVGQITGNRTDEFVLFSGHYDHLGIVSPVNGDSIANGANDDASGVTAVVALAEYFKKRGRPERSLLFAAFTGEESGGYGARYFSEQLNPDQIVAMFNIEMIGKPAVEGPNTAWITGFDRSTFGEILQRAVAGTQYTFYPDPYPQQNLFFRSDNATLARLGVPAHSISTTPIDVDQDYHQVTDEIETLDLDHMTNTISAIATGATTIVSGEETPTRVTIEE